MTIYANLQSNLSISFREDFFKFLLLVAMATGIMHGSISFEQFYRGPSKDYVCEVLSKLTKRF